MAHIHAIRPNEREGP